ncbi:sialin [Venturia canescens]|uniref:sialin n=1 Tax=Venturia canescens TaxID=32260 RepID=UPI001C9CFF4D|nr:sialin [Venturia canescens]
MASLKLLADRLSCRQVLNIMVILGFMLNYMLRVNLTIAIVAMVIHNETGHSSNASLQHVVTAQYGFTESINVDGVSINRSLTAVTTLNNNGTAKEVDFNNTENIYSTINATNDSTFQEVRPQNNVTQLKQTRYAWNEYEVNFILGSFFWGYICTELPGGRLAEVVGAKRVFGYSMLVSSFVTLLTPLAATFGYTMVAALRVVLGFMLGATWPAIQPMTSHWIPPMERSKFVSNMMASSLGAAITMPICGFLISEIGWESVFYVTGGIGVLWSLFWFVLVFDSPAQHPRISDDERRYIQDAIGTTSTTKHLSVPWKAIFTSAPVWAIIITHGCSVFGYFTVVNQLPTYMKYILNFNIKENGLLSSLPYLGKYFFALATATLADHIRRTGKLSVTMIRKIFTTFAILCPSLLMIVLANWGCDRVTSVAIFTAALTLNGAVTAGYLGNGLDIAPNFSGTIFGLANTLSSLGGYLSAMMVGMITYHNQTYAAWSTIFWILAGTYFVGATTFLVFGSGELQSWNNPESAAQARRANEDGAEEFKPLKAPVA